MTVDHSYRDEIHLGLYTTWSAGVDSTQNMIRFDCNVGIAFEVVYSYKSAKMRHLFLAIRTYINTARLTVHVSIMWSST